MSWVLQKCVGRQHNKLNIAQHRNSHRAQVPYIRTFPMNPRWVRNSPPLSRARFGVPRAPARRALLSLTLWIPTTTLFVGQSGLGAASLHLAWRVTFLTAKICAQDNEHRCSHTSMRSHSSGVTALIRSFTFMTRFSKVQ